MLYSLTPRSVLPSLILPSMPYPTRESCLMFSDVQLVSRIINSVAFFIIIQLGSKSLSLSEDEEDKLFSMSLLVISETGFSWKPYREGYLEILFAEFVEPFDISDDNCIWWSRLLSSFING